MGLLRISPRQTSFEVRGFHRGVAARVTTLEQHGKSFVRGYNAALDTSTPHALAEALDALPSAERGFAYEGAAMAFALLDLLSLGRRDRLAHFLAGQGQPHVYMIHVGAGWALARLRLRPKQRLPALDPFLRWLALDGYGFHEAFFHPRQTVSRQTAPRRLVGYERRVFDQGVGRALWFVEGGDVERAAHTVQRFGDPRRADLWSGLALAAAYTAAADADDLLRLRSLAPTARREVAQGAAFAITARHRAGNLVEGSRTAAEVLCDATIDEVVSVVAEARHGLLADPAGQGYERWRTTIGQRLIERSGRLAA